MKQYYLNITLDDTDNLVASYNSLGKLRTLWRRDMDDFLARNGVERTLADQTCWYPYFTRENKDGEIVELSFSEGRGGGGGMILNPQHQAVSL